MSFKIKPKIIKIPSVMLILSIIYIILITVNVYLTFFTDVIFEEVNDKIAYISALTVGLFILIERIQNALHTQWASKEFDNIKFNIDRIYSDINKDSVHRIGTTRQFKEIFLKFCIDATEVKNTFVGFPIRKGGKDTQDELVKGVYSSYFQCNSIGIWKDLVGYKDAFGDRFRMEIQENLISYFRNRHFVGVLRKSTPIINFLIVYGPDRRPRCVFYGWVYFNRNYHDVQLFMSRDEVMIQTFHDYFEHLWSMHTLYEHDKMIPLDYDVPAHERRLDVDIVDKLGLWFTISYEHDSKGLLFDRFALVNIQSDGVLTSISGIVVDDEFKNPRKIHVNPRRVITSTNKIYYEYNHHEQRKNPEDAFCSYRFIREENLIDGIDSDTMLGFYVDNKDGYQKKIFGIRVNDNLLETLNFQGIIETYAQQYSDKLKLVIEKKNSQTFLQPKSSK